jgi:hypothetical protein
VRASRLSIRAMTYGRTQMPSSSWTRPPWLFRGGSERMSIPPLLSFSEGERVERTPSPRHRGAGVALWNHVHGLSNTVTHHTTDRGGKCS